MDLGQMKAAATIDKGHAALVDTLRRLIDRLAADQDGADFIAALRQFVGLADHHFLMEERELQDIGYRNLDAHRAEHANLAQAAEALLSSSVDRFDNFDRWGVALYFLHWLANHIRRQNEAIARFLPRPAGPQPVAA